MDSSLSRVLRSPGSSGGFIPSLPELLFCLVPERYSPGSWNGKNRGRAPTSQRQDAKIGRAHPPPQMGGGGRKRGLSGGRQRGLPSAGSCVLNLGPCPMTSGGENAVYLSADHNNDPALTRPAITSAAEKKSVAIPSITSPGLLRNCRSTRFVGMQTTPASAQSRSLRRQSNGCAVSKPGAGLNVTLTAASRDGPDHAPLARQTWPVEQFQRWAVHFLLHRFLH
jgi:hypothetical protein